jgi:hypothetical protein
MTSSEPPPNPYASPLADALADAKEAEVAYLQLAAKRQQQAVATAASWILGGVLTCGGYFWLLYDLWEMPALMIFILANVIGVGWVLLGITAALGSERGHSVGLVWSYLAAAFFLTHCNLLGAIVVVLIILQSHRLRAFDRQLFHLRTAAEESVSHG